MELTGFSQTVDYKIAATGKAFRNLMDGLYGRKIEAVVRELCTNAYDSHTAAKTPHRRFDLHLPTVFKPKFSVRDYGVGMPHEQVMRRYSTLFDSTKDQSDDEVGMLGLGSKSPFAYTDGFTLRCYDGETRRTYASYLGNGGVPTLSVADISPSTEPRGVEVSFAVKSQDFRAFEEAVVRVMKGFPTLPGGLTAAMEGRIRVAPLQCGDGWAIAQEGYLPRESKVWALQGCVYYPVDIDQLTTEDSELKALRSLGRQILLDFPIGNLEFTPGRETLSYTEITKFNLNYRWKKFRREVDQLFAEKLQNLSSDWERAVAVQRNRLSEEYGTLFDLSHYAAVSRDINQNIRNHLPEEGPDRVAAKRGYRAFTYCTSQERTSYQRRRTRGYEKPYPTSAIDYSGREVIFVERTDEATAPQRRLNHYMRQNNHRYVVGWVVSAKEPHLGRPDLSQWGNPPVINLADLPLPPALPRPPKPRSEWDRYRVFNLSRQNMKYNPSRCWHYTQEEDLPPDTAILFEYDGWIVDAQPGQRANQMARRFDLDKAARLQALNVLLGKPGFFVVRLRGGEVIHRWRKYPVYAEVRHDIVAGMTPAEVARCINIQNAERFNQSIYQDAPNRLRNALRAEAERERRSTSAWGSVRSGRRKAVPNPKPVGRNPIAALERFTTRFAAIPYEERLRLEQLRGFLTHQDEDYLITRALEMGLEVLPEPCYSTKLFPYDLLPLPWENLARMLVESGGSSSVSWSISALIHMIAEEK